MPVAFRRTRPVSSELPRSIGDSRAKSEPAAVPDMHGDRRHDDDAPARLVADGASPKVSPYPGNRERRLQRVDQGVLRRRDHLTAHGEQDQPQAELGRPEQEQIDHIACSDPSGVANGQTSSGHSSADRHAAGSMGVS